MSTSMIVADVLENEMIVFGLMGFLIVGIALYWEFIIRRWSWMPRRKQRKSFTERW